MRPHFQGKTVLVIGGTGTIGRRIVELLMPWEPAVIRILSRDEGKQFEMAHELDNNDLLRFFIGDVREASTLTTSATLRRSATSTRAMSASRSSHVLA